MNTPLAVPVTQPLGKDLKNLSSEALTTIAGMLAASLVIAINMGLERSLDLDLLGLTYAFILPVGAIIGGFGSALGYYAAAKATQTLPSRRMLFEMLAIAVSTWLIMHWVEYVTLQFSDGRMARDVVPFWDYLRIRTEHLQLVLESAGSAARDATPELGMLGYVHELIQITGFLIGGLVVWLVLKGQEACVLCSRYARQERVLQRAPTHVFDDLLQRCGVMLGGFAEQVARVAGNRRLVGLNLSMATCPSCHRSWIRPAAVVFDRNNAVARPLDRHDLTSAQAAALQAFVPKKR
jgi:hypothetical protein